MAFISALEARQKTQEGLDALAILGAVAAITEGDIDPLMDLYVALVSGLFD